MEELLELEQCLLTSDIEKAIEITQELIEMSKADILRKIESYLKILLIHLIKQKVENRTTKSWNYSIKESSEQIKKINKRRRARSGVAGVPPVEPTEQEASGWYASSQELEEMCQNVFESAIGKASLEIFDGTLNDEEIEEKINRKELIEKVIALIGN